MSVRGLDMISFTSGGGAAGANCAASAQAAIVIGRMIFFMATSIGLAQICFSFKTLTKRRSATAGGAELCWTLNYHLSTLNFLSTTASGGLERLVRHSVQSIR